MLFNKTSLCSNAELVEPGSIYLTLKITTSHSFLTTLSAGRKQIFEKSDDWWEE